MKETFIINEELVSLRIDKALAILLPSISRNRIISLIEEGNVLLNEKTCKASTKLKLHDQVFINNEEIKESGIQKEDIPLDIIYEDDDILILNKPQGMVVHPGNGHHDGTLVNALMAHTDKLSVIGGEYRPGIIHRIDKNTSGLLCIAKNDEAHNFLSEQLKTHTMHREYYALVKGLINENEGKIDLPIGRDTKNRQLMGIRSDGKPSVTYFKVLHRYKNHTLISCRLETGRTHQIRVHMAYIKHPVESDPEYGKKPFIWDKGQLLHAYKLTLIHPRSKKEVTFEAPLPEYFLNILKTIE